MLASRRQRDDVLVERGDPSMTTAPGAVEDLPPRGALGRRLKALGAAQQLQLLVATAILWGALAIAVPGFATGGNTQNMARVGAVLVIVAIGQLFPLLVGGFDISVGNTMGFASVVG